jgi:hypothetical protein
MKHFLMLCIAYYEFVRLVVGGDLGVLFHDEWKLWWVGFLMVIFGIGLVIISFFMVGFG